ncbi:hypothetical protein NE237_014464 [Protea cynaroides]|uniref:Uncharacterized protein n=1 Tax=Protea cynaroides TaxID=273540 RepID=A0A9Q0KC29_9MAGN|nr:hypothetical protein NE237_014464 [Protea cynaroides]
MAHSSSLPYNRPPATPVKDSMSRQLLPSPTRTLVGYVMPRKAYRQQAMFEGLIKAWRCKFDVKEFWVQFHDVPAPLFILEFAHQMGVWLGTPSVAMIITSYHQGTPLNYLRTRIALDLSKPLLALNGRTPSHSPNTVMSSNNEDIVHGHNPSKHSSPYNIPIPPPPAPPTDLPSSLHIPQPAHSIILQSI